ncbi:MJ1477/TM1410 family putative glycoside hydrolase [bacterium]
MQKSVNLILLWLFVISTLGFCHNRVDFQALSSFTYQLQDLNLEAVGEAGFDLVIMDYSSEGDDESAYTAHEINTLKNSPGGPKMVLSYLSIGEAEDYRFYWQENWKPGNPQWLDQVNPYWEGNYKVRYWDPEWQDIIFSYLDRILSAGFDGVYLDIIDAYETYLYFSSVQASLEMVNFVQSIREYIRPKNENFLIFVQNAAELATMHPIYLNAVDGIGQEDIYFGYDSDGEPTPVTVTEEMQTNLDVFLNAGKLVLTVDYPFSESEDVPHFDQTTLNKIENAYNKSRIRGYIPYCTVRNLNYLTINPGYEPTSIEEAGQAKFFHLTQNYPNPFNQQTVINYQLPVRQTDGGSSTACWVRIQVFDILGREVDVLVDEMQTVGYYKVYWNASTVPSGIYFYQITAGAFKAVRKMGLVK